MTNGFGQDGFGDNQGASLNNSVSKMITDALTATGIAIDDDDYRARLLVFLNKAYLKILKGRHWNFMNRELALDLQAPYDTGNVSLTQGSYDVANVDIPLTTQWNATMLGQLFIPTGQDLTQYRVSEVPTATTLKLQAKFAEDSVTSSAYKILFDRIFLEANVSAIRSLSISGRGEIRPLGLQEFRVKKSSNPGVTGTPQFYTLVRSEAQSGNWTLELWPSPDKRYTAHVEFSLNPVGLTDEDSCFSMIPPKHIDVLHWEMLAEIYRIQENPTLLADARSQAIRTWNIMASDFEMTDSKARIQPGRRYFTRPRQVYQGYYGLAWFGKVEP
ncbi:MAG: hypothetical protein E6R04_04790 [Spirochaetes bacterium]|nr:MAG: hypothetical protein E6R04_04790 [Spirochaetota bacterium]